MSGIRANRKSLYGNLIKEVDAVVVPNNKVRKNPQAGQTAKKTGKSAYPSVYPSYGTSTTPKFAPITDEVTVYGAKKFRSPIRADEFVGKKGTHPKAFILDIDGTITDHGMGINKTTLAWAKKHLDKGEIAVVITARGPSMFTSSFNYLMHTLPFPFVGPFMREDDDPRYASEFKRELAEDLSKVYDFTGAADDNEWVIKMWKQWAIDHFIDPKDFDVLECGYTSYPTWRKDLPNKVGKETTYGAKYYDDHWDPDLKKMVPNKKDGKIWVPSRWIAAEKKTIPAHWAPDPDAGKVDPYAKNRPAGTQTYPQWSQDPSDGKYKKTSEHIQPPLPEEFGKDLRNSEAWKDYFDKREASGAYVASDLHDEIADLLDEQEETTGYSLYRNDLVQIVRHEYPGYTEKELDDMDISNLRELAGFTGKNQHQSWTSLFTDEQLGIDGDVSDEDRNEKISIRMMVEEEVYSEYLSLTKMDIELADLNELELLIEVAPFLTLADREDLTDVEAALKLARNIQKYLDEVDPDDDLDDVVDGLDVVVEGEVVEEESPATGPLDVAEVLTEMNENDVPPQGVDKGLVHAAELDETIKGLA